jgi:FkbM family methyltransferase
MLQKLARFINLLTGGRLSNSRALANLYYRSSTYLNDSNIGEDFERYEIDGFDMFLDPSTKHQIQIIHDEHEPGVTDLLSSRIDDEMTVFDIGAHIGYYTLLSAKTANKVVSVEPSPAAHRLLQKNIKCNDFENINVVQNGVFAEKGEMELNIHPGDEQVSNSFANAPSLQGGSIKVPVTTVDALAEEHGSPNLVKIDVEGAELRVLHGMSETLSDNVDLIIETHSSTIERYDRMGEFGDSLEELIGYLESFGYQIYSIDADGSIEEVHHNDDDLNNIYVTQS